jgi:hypothetical protein
MAYTETCDWYSKQQGLNEGKKPGKDNTWLKYYHFSSGSRLVSPFQPNPSTSIYQQDDHEENDSFNYPVILPAHGHEKYSSAIVLLHGLNEKSWLKYFAWAEYMCMATSKPVIMFPISYHMNRAPRNWSNPKLVMKDVFNRKSSIHARLTSFANVALSERLSSNPGRFFISGHQSAVDITGLATSIYGGQHPLFEKGSRVDFFAYSIGALLAQVLFIANPSNLFRDSKYFFFCGGSVFEAMNGSSKYIMDSKAYQVLKSYYMNSINKGKNKKDELYRVISGTVLGNAFHTLLALKNLKQSTGNVFAKYPDQFITVAMKNDKVIPMDGITATLQGTMVSIVNFPFQCSHENPFPVFRDERSMLVDREFEKIFIEASRFLSE